MNDYELADSVVDSMAEMSSKVISHYDQDNLDDAYAIIGEWTMEDNTCVLTKFITDDTESIDGELLFCSVENSEFSYGTFTFDPEAELPVDNNWFFYNLISLMNLTDDQRQALAQRIFDNFDSFVRSELDYQIEDAKDNDELDWDYYLKASDAEDITRLLIDMIAVPVR